MTLKRKASLAVRSAVRKGTITSEEEARKIARKFLRGVPSYEITGAISNELPRTIKTIHNKTSFKHPWFIRKSTRIVYTDIWGRVWNKTTGIIRKTTKLYVQSKRYMWIDELGGMMWTSNNGKNFVCEFRTSLEEFNAHAASPETFIG